MGRKGRDGPAGSQEMSEVVVDLLTTVSHLIG